MPRGLWLLLALGCGGAPDDTGGADCARRPPLTWDNFGRGFMGKHCAGCHSSLHEGDMRKGAPAGVDLDTYGGVLQWVSRIEARTLSDPMTMPPGGGPSDEEVGRLREWLDCQVYRDAAAQAGRSAK
jgi:hypothetical protein